MAGFRHVEALDYQQIKGDKTYSHHEICAGPLVLETPGQLPSLLSPKTELIMCIVLYYMYCMTCIV